jgi:hypothetical protein
MQIDDIDFIRPDESKDNSRTRSVSGTEEFMSYGGTQDAHRTDNRNPSAAANSYYSFTGCKTGHQDQRLPDTGKMNGHIYTEG